MQIGFHRVTSCLLVGIFWTVTFNQSADAVTANSVGAWDYAAQAAEDGSLNRVLARLTGEEGSALWLTCTRVVADEGAPPEALVAATITQKGYLGPSDPKGRSTVYWLDKQPPEVSYWVYRDRYGQLREPDKVKSFVASLTTAETLIVDLADYRLESRSVKFALKPNETKTIAERFERDCQAVAVVED
jgi:hypothetical protein